MNHPNELTRRDFVAVGAAVVAGAAAGCRPARPTPPPLGAAELAELSAVDAVAAMTKGEVTAERYAGVLLDRCREWKSLNAFITLTPERVLESARGADQARRAGRPLGALHGLPIPIKDSVNTRDLPTTAGTHALARFQPAEDAPIVARLRAAGGFVLGKTNLHEMSFGWTSSNEAFGPVRNPYDPTRIPGGSSGGTAAAVAARMAPLGVAEDTEGSIRVPAAMCGIAGFRPTTGRYPSVGVVPISALFDQVGPHARTVGDLILFDRVAAPDPKPVAPRSLPGVRLAVIRSYYFAGLDPEVDRLVTGALGSLRAAGVEMVETDLPELPKLIGQITGPVQIHDAYYTVKQYLADYRTGVTIEQLIDQASPAIRDEIRRYVVPGGKDAVSESFYRVATTTHLPALRAEFQKLFAATGASAIVFPTTMTPPVKIGEDRTVMIGGRTIPFETAISRNIAPGSTAGLPGLVLPVGLTRGGLPVTIELDGPSGSDRDLLALGLGIEAVLGHLPPPRLPTT
jgi:mandelamide amidase